MFQFPGFAPHTYAFSVQYSVNRVGFPIRKSIDHSSVTSSLWLIAGSNVLHRLLTPRHPPCALSRLITPTCRHDMTPDWLKRTLLFSHVIDLSCDGSHTGQASDLRPPPGGARSILLATRQPHTPQHTVSNSASRLPDRRCLPPCPCVRDDVLIRAGCQRALVRSGHPPLETGPL